MRIQVKIILTISAVLILGAIAFTPLKTRARAHVNLKTGVEDHPLLCTSCHLYISDNPVLKAITNARYVSPFNLAVSDDGNLLYVVAQDRNELLIVNTAKGKVSSRIRVGNHPHSVILSRDGKKAFVTNQWSDNVYVIDTDSEQFTDTLMTSGGPAGLSLSSNPQTLYVVNSFSSDISVFDLASGKEKNRLKAGNNPTGSCLSPDGKSVYVTSRRALSAPYGTPLTSELTIIDDATGRVREKLNIESAYLSENIDFTPSGDLAIFTLIRPKNLVPSIQVEQGFMMTHGFGIIETTTGRITEFLLDEPNSYYPDPFDVIVSKDGTKAFITSSGVDCISVVSIDSIRNILRSASAEELKTIPDNRGISSRYVIKRIRTGSNPKGLALSPDGKSLYVAEHLEDRISVISIESLKITGTIDLGGPSGVTVSRRGERLMNNAGHTFQNQFSCYTCHPDGHEDGLVYNMASKDMGRNLTNTQSLRDISKTAPFKWNGKNQTVYKQDGIRFSTVLTRTEQFSYKDLDAITCYIMTGIKYPPNLQYNPDGNLNEAQLQGKMIFERTKEKSGKVIPENNRCVTCHPAPYYTNRKMADVSTLAATDDPMLFDTPHLNNIYASAPYLHDGRAATLEEIWTVYGIDNRHGMVGDLTKMELNYLIEYLKSLRSPEYDK
jgi:YVTN family beta-propeller protein